MPKSAVIYAPGKWWKASRDTCMRFCLDNHVHVVGVAHTKPELQRLLRNGAVDLVVTARLSHAQDLPHPPVVVVEPGLAE